MLSSDDDAPSLPLQERGVQHRFKEGVASPPLHKPESEGCAMSLAETRWELWRGSETRAGGGACVRVMMKREAQTQDSDPKEDSLADSFLRPRPKS